MYFYKVRLKQSVAPYLKTQFVDGIYVANEIPTDTEAVKAQIAEHTRKKLQREFSNVNPLVEVVVFRRSDIRFLLVEDSPDMEDSQSSS